jgi:hypothetical protein
LDKLTTDISIYFTSLIKPTAATGGSQLPAPAAVAAAAAAASQGGGAGVGGAREEEQEEMGGRWEPAFSDDTGGDDEEAMEEEEEEEEEDDTTREAGGDETSLVSGSIQGHALGDRWGEEDEASRNQTQNTTIHRRLVGARRNAVTRTLSMYIHLCTIAITL